MTRNPETTEAAKAALEQQIAAVLREHRCVHHGTYVMCEAEFAVVASSEGIVDEPDEGTVLHQAAVIAAAVLAVSPAVTEGERARHFPTDSEVIPGAVVCAWDGHPWPCPASPAVTAAEDETHGYCTCDGPRPMRDCGVKAHRDQAFAARPAPVVAAVPAEPALPSKTYCRTCRNMGRHHCRTHQGWPTPYVPGAAVPADPNKED